MSYSSLLLSTSPVAYWPLNDAAGATTIADASGNGHAAAPMGAPVFGAPGLIPGETDTACLLDGASVISLPNLNLVAPFTLSGVVKPTGDGGRNVGMGTLIGYGGEGTGNRRILWNDGSDKIQVEMGKPDLISTAVLAAGTPHPWAYVNDGTNESLYVDGALQGSQANNLASWNGPAFIGGYGVPGGSYELKGTVEKVAVHNVALPAATIASLATAALAPLGSNGVTAFSWNGTAYVPALGFRVYVGSQQPAGLNPNDVWLQTS